MHSHTGLAGNYFTHGFPFCHDLRSSFKENNRVASRMRWFFPSARRCTITRQLYEIFPQCCRMFIPFAMVDTRRETRRQARMLEQQIERQRFYGLKVHPRATQARLSTLGREGRPLREFARACDLPILFHTAYRGSPDCYSQISNLLVIVRAPPRLRFYAAHFCGFHEPSFEEVARYKNVWIDSAALSIGCDLACRNPASTNPARLRSYYRDPSKVFADARRYPEKFMWRTDNPARRYVSHSSITLGGPAVHLELGSSIDMAAAMCAYQAIGFKGSIRPDQVPLLFGEERKQYRNYAGSGEMATIGPVTGYSKQARVFAVAYMHGLLPAIVSHVDAS